MIITVFICSLLSVAMSTVVQSTPPLFIKDSDIGNPAVTPYEVCNAVIKASSAGKVEGV